MSIEIHRMWLWNWNPLLWRCVWRETMALPIPTTLTQLGPLYLYRGSLDFDAVGQSASNPT